MANACRMASNLPKCEPVGHSPGAVLIIVLTTYDGDEDIYQSLHAWISEDHSCAARAIAEREVHEDINPRDIRVAVGYRSLDRSVEV